jgi:glutaredoxin
MIKKTLLTSKTCGPCMVVKNKLKALKLEVDILEYNKENEEFFNKHGVKSVPRLVVEDENGVTIIQGSDDIIAEIQKE